MFGYSKLQSTYFKAKAENPFFEEADIQRLRVQSRSGTFAERGIYAKAGSGRKVGTEIMVGSDFFSFLIQLSFYHKTPPTFSLHMLFLESI